MEHQHTVIFFDCRPMKAAAHHVIDQYSTGVIGLDAAVEQLHALAASLPDLDPSEYASHQRRLLMTNNCDRARRLVDCLQDRTLRAWVRPTLLVLWSVVKLGALAAFVWFVVWLAT